MVLYFFFEKIYYLQWLKFLQFSMFTSALLLLTIPHCSFLFCYLSFFTYCSMDIKSLPVPLYISIFFIPLLILIIFLIIKVQLKSIFIFHICLPFFRCHFHFIVVQQTLVQQILYRLVLQTLANKHKLLTSVGELVLFTFLVAHVLF